MAPRHAGKVAKTRLKHKRFLVCHLVVHSPDRCGERSLPQHAFGRRSAASKRARTVFSPFVDPLTACLEDLVQTHGCYLPSYGIAPRTGRKPSRRLAPAGGTMYRPATRQSNAELNQPPPRTIRSTGGELQPLGAPCEPNVGFHTPSQHHSSTFPAISYSPYPFGAKLPTDKVNGVYISIPGFSVW